MTSRFHVLCTTNLVIQPAVLKVKSGQLVKSCGIQQSLKSAGDLLYFSIREYPPFPSFLPSAVVVSSPLTVVASPPGVVAIIVVTVACGVLPAGRVDVAAIPVADAEADGETDWVELGLPVTVLIALASLIPVLASMPVVGAVPVDTTLVVGAPDVVPLKTEKQDKTIRKWIWLNQIDIFTRFISYNLV